MSNEGGPDEHALTPDEVRAAREAYIAEHGGADFQPDPNQAPPPITGMPEHLEAPPETPHEPYIEPEGERNRPVPPIVIAQPPRDTKK